MSKEMSPGERNIIVEYLTEQLNLLDSEITRHQHRITTAPQDPSLRPDEVKEIVAYRQKRVWECVVVKQGIMNMLDDLQDDEEEE